MDANNPATTPVDQLEGVDAHVAEITDGMTVEEISEETEGYDLSEDETEIETAFEEVDFDDDDDDDDWEEVNEEEVHEEEVHEEEDYAMTEDEATNRMNR